MQEVIPFSPPLADAKDYPPPRFSATPSSRENKTTSLLARPLPRNAIAVIPGYRARYALALAAYALLPKGATVLAPAYHCPAMIEPLVWAGCRVIFYRMTPNLEPDPDDLEIRLRDADAILLSRFFGFDSGVTEYARVAHRADCVVIEDLAHAALAADMSGDIAFTSLAKFFACDSGAELFVRSFDQQQRIMRAAETLHDSQPVWLLRNLKERVRRKLFDRNTPKRHLYRYFDPMQLARPEIQQSEPPDNGLCQIDIVKRRRWLYLELHDTLVELRPEGLLHKNLPSDVAPYVLPYLISSQKAFDALRNAGTPLQRWEELAETECRVSTDYRLRLIQLPVHQSMTDDDLAFLKLALRQSLQQEAAG